MKPILLMVAAMAAAAAVPAQANFNFSLPIPAPTSANNYPFAGPIMRYQQWYSAADWVRAAVHPVRVNTIAWPAGTPGGQTGANVDCEISIANGPMFGPSAQFDANLLGGRVTAPRANRLLGTATPGSFPMLVTLPTDFVWDGASSVVVEVKVFGNGRGNNAFAYDLRAATSGSPGVQRLFNVAGANEQFAAVIQPGWGLATRFTFQEGVSVPFGQGCPGSGNVIPVAGAAGGLPLPANAGWQQTLAQAASQRAAVLILGGSRDTFSGNPLPIDLGLIGFHGCRLLVAPSVFLPATTVGGGPGAGTAAVTVPIPPVTIFFRGYLFAQWMVLDPGAVAPGLAASNGVWNIIGG